MTVTYNNEQGASNLITFSDIPNILKVEDYDGGEYASFVLTFQGDLKGATTSNNQWYIKILGETISNVIDYNNVANKSFYVATSPSSTAAYVTKALRNCPNIIANFTVEHTDASVTLKARAVGAVWSRIRGGWYDTNIASQYLTTTATDGTSYSELGNAKIQVDVISNGDYITTLEKTFYGGECAFNMSPVLTTLAKHGEAIPYTLKLSYIKDGEYGSIGTVGTNYISVGYMCNQGSKFLDNSYLTVAQNYSRGTVKTTSNNSVLYVYGQSIPISFYNGVTGGMYITARYRDSAFGEIGSTQISWRNTDSTKKLWDVIVPLSQLYLQSAFYVDIELGSSYVIRYNVIKPLKATEYYQRICWRNSYGGIAYFDFTGQKSETRSVDISTYQKNIFDYYTDDKNELAKIYDNKVDYVVTLKSHLIEEDGKYIFNDLLQSSEVWTEINGETYSIIIDSVSVEETDNNNIYEATVKYKYSMTPSII